MLAVPKSTADKSSMSKSTTSMQFLSQDLPGQQSGDNEKHNKDQQQSYNSFEYEDISFTDDDGLSSSAVDEANASTSDLLIHKSVRRSKPTDILARESDVIISTQITPLTEYKGFTLYLISALFHIVWLLWTFLPKKWLNVIGVYYYPSRWWSLSISTVVLVFMLYIYIGLQLWNIEYETVKIDDLRTIIDDDAVIEKDWKKFGWTITSGVYDLRITDVNKILYDD